MNPSQHSYRAHIAPVDTLSTRPLWSVMIPSHNCAQYLQQTLESVLAQDPGPDFMQIEVIDDHSTQDQPEAVVAEIGQGRVGFYQQTHNVGHIKNFQTCLEQSRGILVHLLHGDDYVRGGFYQNLGQTFAKHPEIGAAFCRHIYMDEQGHWQDIAPLEQPHAGILPNWLERIAVRQRIQTPAMVVRRDVYETLGGFDQRLIWAEDWEMWVRIAAHYPVWYEPTPLAVYRVHTTSNSNQLIRTGQNVEDTRRAVNIIKPYLPSAQVNNLSDMALEYWAITALYQAKQSITTGNKQIALVQMKQALRCRLSAGIIARIIYYLLLMLLNILPVHTINDE